MRVQISTWPDHRARNLSLLRRSRNILFVIGILALGYYGYASADARIFQAYQTRQFEQTVRHPTPGSPVVETSNPPIPIGGPPPQAARSNAFGFDIPGSPGSVLGRIEIKRIELAVMILEGTDNRALRRAVGHIPKTALPGQPGNVGIAGHRDTFFRDLRKIEKNDEITLTTLNGSFRYVADFSEVVEPNDTEVLYPSSDAILTLVTCYPFYYVGPAPKRLVVRAHLNPQ
jgi:sortase A